jgi:HAD superfamily hydrolase (TIGR01509 family)
MDLRDIRAVVFDLDGTLCRYTVSTAEGIAYALEQANLPQDALGDLEETAAHYNGLWGDFEWKQEAIGRTRAAVWQRLVDERGGVDPVLVPQLSEDYAAIRMPSVKLFPGARELLVALRPSYRVGLLTNGPSTMQWPKIHGMEIEPLFDAIVVAGDIGIYKPDPRAFAAILERLGHEADDAVYIGDSLPMDIAGAAGAGLRSVWIRRNGEAPDPELRPDHTLTDVTELEAMLL